MKTLTFACALIACSLTACATSRVNDDAPASDLDALVMGVKAKLPARTLPNGKLYCVELSTTEQQHDTCADDLEDLAWSQHNDADITIDFVVHAVEKLKLARNPCSMFRAMIHPSKC